MDPKTEVNRLRVLRSTNLLDSPPEPAFDRLTRMASRLVNAPAALVSLVDERRQFFKSVVGLGEPWASARETPLSHSFCQYAVRDREPLVVNDAREHPVLKTNLAVVELDVVAYAGIPLFIQGEPIGVFCVVDDKPRVWSAEELGLLSDLAQSVVSEIELRLSLRAAEDQRALTNALLDGLGDGVLAIDQDRKFLIANAAARRMFAKGAEVGQVFPSTWSAIHRSTLPNGSKLDPEEGALPRALRGELTDGLEFTLEPPGAKEGMWVEATGRPVHGPSGAVIAAVAVYRDVTERKRRLDLFAALAHNIPRGAVVLFDADLRCLAIDGELARSDTVDSRAAVGRPMRELAGDAGKDPSFDAVEDACRRTISGESLGLDFSYGGRTFSLHTAPIRGAMRLVASGILLALDVTEQRRDQAAVRQSEQLYRAIVQNLPKGAVFMLDRDMRFLSADGSALDEIMKSSPISAGDLVGRTMSEVVPAENREATTNMVIATLQGARQRMELVRGSSYYELIAEPVVDSASGEISSALLFCFDVTERKQAHDALARERAALAQFRTFVEYISIGITILRAGCISYMNPAMLKMLGHENESALIGRTIESLIHEDDRGLVSARVIAAETSEIAPRRTRIFRKDGTTVTVESIARPFEFEGARSVVAASRDMSDEINAEVARRETIETLAAFRLTVEAIRGYAIFQLDPEGRVRTWNVSARAITGHEADEIVGSHIRIFYPPEDQGKSELALAVARSAERYEEEGWRVRKDGTRFWAGVVITALRDKSNVVSGFVKIARDLTERKQTEDAKARSLAEKTAMLQEIHHRVKNNLQMISSLLKLQARQIKDTEARAMFLDTQSRVRSIALLHESLYQSDDLGRVDMKEYLDKLVATLRRAYGETSPCDRFTIEVDRMSLPLDAAVPCGLIINELITNALKHAFDEVATRDHNEIRIVMHRESDTLVISVADNGTGFDTDFDLGRAETMGMMLVADLSSQLRGSVELVNRNGATCTIRFPAPGEGAGPT